jgi:hypothetical protein
MKKEAYPQTFCRVPHEPYNIEKWKKAALKINVASREYKEHSLDNIIDHFTREWVYHEAEAFKRWMDYNHRYKKGQDMTMQKVAYDFGATQKEERLGDLKKKLRSRVSSAERLLNKMMDEGLLGGNTEKAIYIGRILQKLKEEINLLQRPQLIEARHKRATRTIRKAGLIEIAALLDENIQLIAGFDKVPFIKKAQFKEGIVPVLEAIKEELDIFNYGTHLRKLMSIASQLDEMGQHSESGMVIDIIKKELDGLDSIHKKLVDVYTAIGQIPRQRAPEPAQPRIEKPMARPQGAPRI